MDIPTENTETLQNGIEHLEKIEADLKQIKDLTANPRRSFFNGILSGAGAIIGSIAALLLLSWILSLLGVLPGFGSLATYLHSVVDRFDNRY